MLLVHYLCFGKHSIGGTSNFRIKAYSTIYPISH